MQLPKRLYILLISGLCMACSTSTKVPQQSTPSTDEGAALSCSDQLLFYSDRSGNGDLYNLNLESLELSLFEGDSLSDGAPRYSPFYQEIVFSREINGQRTLYKKSLSNGEAEFLINNPAGDEVPSWAPNRNRIVFSKEVNPSSYQLVVMELETGYLQVLHEGANQPYQPQWSPTSDHIAFVLTDTLHNGDIFTIQADGSKLTAITNSDRLHGYPSWSPDGEKLIFYRYNESADLFSYHLTSQDLRQLTFSASNILLGRYSTDGSSIAYGAEVDGNWELFVMDADGNNKSRLTFNPAFDGDPIWLPCR